MIARPRELAFFTEAMIYFLEAGPALMPSWADLNAHGHFQMECKRQAHD